MTSTAPSIEFFKGVSEELDNVSLRRDPKTGSRQVLFIFKKLQAINNFNSFTRSSNSNLTLNDEEGEITIQPDGIKFIFAGDEGDDLAKVECRFQIENPDHWERFMRFMNRYAKANSMGYQDK